MHGDLDKLIAFVTAHFPFDENVYPELKGADEKQRFLFAVRHSAIHFAKTAGKIAAVSEDADHGDDIDTEKLKENVPKALINTLRLAELLGMSEKDLTRAIEEKYKNNIE
ncbi:MAG: hypothetical protein AAB581_03215 [Patescibacteria group bacterium]